MQRNAGNDDNISTLENPPPSQSVWVLPISSFIMASFRNICISLKQRTPQVDRSHSMIRSTLRHYQVKTPSSHQQLPRSCAKLSRSVSAPLDNLCHRGRLPDPVTLSRVWKTISRLYISKIFNSLGLITHHLKLNEPLNSGILNLSTFFMQNLFHNQPSSRV